MKKYEYKFIEVPKNALKKQKGDTFKECQNIIIKEADDGWRLKQIVVPFNEKLGIYGAWCYQIVFEREI